MKVTTIVEVGPDGAGGWAVTVVRTNPGLPENPPEILGRYRRKSNAVHVGTGAAKALHVELHVKNRKGHYTAQAASFGHDPKEIRG